MSLNSFTWLQYSVANAFGCRNVQLHSRRNATNGRGRSERSKFWDCLSSVAGLNFGVVLILKLNITGV